MSLYAFEKPENPWYPENMDEFWWMFRAEREYNERLNTTGSLKIKRYKRVIKESTHPECCCPHSEGETAYMFFFLGFGKEYTQHGGGADISSLHSFDRVYRDGGENEEGGCVWIERNKRWFAPRKAQIFI